MRHAVDGEAVDPDGLGLAPDRRDPKLAQDLEDAAAAPEAWSRVVAGDNERGDVGVAQLCEAAQRLDDRARRGPRRVEQIARVNEQIRLALDRDVDGGVPGVVDVALALIQVTNGFDLAAEVLVAKVDPVRNLNQRECDVYAAWHAAID